MAWTQFHDMHSKGYRKTDYDKIYIEGPEDEAIEVFKEWFGRDPFHVTCPCCGPDFSTIEFETLEEATQFDREMPVRIAERRGEVDEPIPLEEYLGRDEIRVIHKEAQ